jgi:hypothetical protein
MLGPELLLFRKSAAQISKVLKPWSGPVARSAKFSSRDSPIQTCQPSQRAVCQSVGSRPNVRALLMSRRNDCPRLTVPRNRSCSPKQREARSVSATDTVTTRFTTELYRGRARAGAPSRLWAKKRSFWKLHGPSPVWPGHFPQTPLSRNNRYIGAQRVAHQCNSGGVRDREFQFPLKWLSER